MTSTLIMTDAQKLAIRTLFDGGYDTSARFQVVLDELPTVDPSTWGGCHPEQREAIAAALARMGVDIVPIPSELIPRMIDVTRIPRGPEPTAPSAEPTRGELEARQLEAQREAIALGRQWAASGHLVWRAGMSYLLVSPSGVVQRRRLDYHPVPTGVLHKAEHVPDLLDVPTAGCLLADVRAAWNDPFVHVEYVARHANSGQERWEVVGTWREQVNGERLARTAAGPTEIAALVTALLAPSPAGFLSARDHAAGRSADRQPSNAPQHPVKPMPKDPGTPSVGPDPTPHSPRHPSLPTPLLLLSPRAPFTVALGGDTFLCYVYRSLDGLVAQGPGTSAEMFFAHASSMFRFLGTPVLVVVGDPIEGTPVYRPSQRAIEALPIGDPAADPGVCIGHLVRSTLEATKQTSASTLAELDALRDQGHLVSDELHTAFGERSVWAIDGTDSVLVRCSGIVAAFRRSFVTSDLDGTEKDGTAKIAIRRARAALDPLRPIDRMIANGSVRPIELEMARAIDSDLTDRLLRHDSLEERP